MPNKAQPEKGGPKRRPKKINFSFVLHLKYYLWDKIMRTAYTIFVMFACTNGFSCVHT
jgi:hypothetical protein